jgi:hypothetical protein
MVSNFFRVAFGLSILSKVLCQVAMADRPAQYTDDIPNEEKMALASIVEDDPDDMSIAAKDWESPEYPLLFRQALPIPPAKQPK